MKLIKVKNTYDLPILGRPSRHVRECLDVEVVGLCPSSDSRVKPKLLVKEGDSVQEGQVLYFDKVDETVKYVSPGTGVVSKLSYGPKRRLDEIVITLSDSKEVVSFDSLVSAGPDKMDRDAIVHALHEGGLWQRLTAYPFQSTPKADAIPPSIYVSLDYDEAFMPETDVYLKGRLDDLKLGLSVLSKLATNVHVGVAEKTVSLLPQLKDITTHVIAGHYPANHPGVFLFYNKTDVTENSSWGIRGLDVLAFGEFFRTGKFPTQKMIVIGGDLASDASHVLTREGVSVTDLVAVPKEPARFIAGGVLTGRKLASTSFVGYSEYALNVIREGRALEMLTFFRPGFDKPTFSKAYLSALLGKVRLKMTSSLNGGSRSCISCGSCPSVCPVGILPQFIMKDLLVGDMESAVDHGFLDCVSCGLCTYVCPSKIDLDGLYKEKLDRLAKDV
jgi:Na+-transporting NADH:ubiquinone oxidoreductase subunit A